MKSILENRPGLAKEVNKVAEVDFIRSEEHTSELQSLQ